MPSPDRNSRSTAPTSVTTSEPSSHRVRERPVASSASSRPADSSERMRSAEETAKPAASTAMISSIVEK